MKLKETVDAIEKLDKLQAVAEDTKTVLFNIQDELLKREAMVTSLTADNKMLTELLHKHGGHTEDCGYIEECESGRILKDQEEELCDCGWSETMLMIESRMSQWPSD